MTNGRARIAASILDSDLSNLQREVRRATKAGADRLHLDVMDGHFVPNLTFGAKTIKWLRAVSSVPFDAHLMISEPGRYMDQFLDAGCESVTFQVEIEEPIRPTLEKIRAAGRAAGLAIKPGTPVSAVTPYADLLDIVMVMTVEPGFGGQSYMRDAAAKVPAARDVFAGRTLPGEVHIDGGVNRDTAEAAGAFGGDVFVAGSALFKPGRDMAREVRLIRGMIEAGYRRRLAGGEPPASGTWPVFATLPKRLATKLTAEIRAAGLPVLQLRSEAPAGPDGLRDDDLLVPADAEARVIERFGDARALALREAEASRESMRAAV